MANPQHIKWLLEGVEAWNARRERDDFEPKFEGKNIQEAFREAGLMPSDGRINLQGINLRQANLSRANLLGANLRGADLQGTDLKGAELRGVNLSGAYLLGANLLNTSLNGAIVISNPLTVRENNRIGIENTDLSYSLNLLQHQLDKMYGNQFTKIPTDLTRPAHWLEPDVDKTEAPTTESKPTPTRTKELQSHVNLLIRTAPAVEITASSLALQINAFIAEYRLTAGNDIPDEVIELETLAETFAHFGKMVVSNQPESDKIAELESQVAFLKTLVENLTKSGNPSDFNVIKRKFYEAIGTSLGTGLVAGVGFLLGAYGPTAVVEFAEFMGGFIPSTPPTTPTPVISV